MKKLSPFVILPILLGRGPYGAGIVYKFKGGIGMQSNITEYFKEETLKPVITHVTTGTGNLKGLRYSYWLSSYGLTGWCVSSKLNPRRFGFKEM